MMAGWKNKKPPDNKRDLKATQLDTRGQAPATESRASPSWKRAKGRTGGRSFWQSGTGINKSKRPPWFIPLLLLMGTAGILAYWLTLQATTTDMVVLVGLKYETPWQPNAWAKEDAERFKDVFNRKRALRCMAPVMGDDFTNDWENALTTSLGKAESGGPGGPRWWWKYKALVVYISAHGVLGTDNEPYLVFAAKPNEALGGQMKSAAPLGKLLQLIADKRADSRVLLIVDLGRQLPDARTRGVGLAIDDSKSTADFMSRAKSQVETITNNNLAVLFSASPEQISWPAPELGGTVFGTYVTQGFKGLADVNGNKDQVVTVQELFRYVQKEVKAYVESSRAAVQEPLLFWGGNNQTPGDFDVAYCEKAPTIPAVKNMPVPSLDKLGAAWDKFELWRSQQLRSDPWRVAEIRNKLSYAEQNALAGGEYASRAASEINEAMLQMDRSGLRSAEFVGTSRFHGAPPEPRFALPAPEPAAVSSETAPTDKSKSTDKPVPPSVQKEEPKPEAKPTYADTARAWLMSPVGENGLRTAVFPTVKTPEEYLEYIQFCWWWLKDSDHWTQAQVKALEGLKPQFEVATSDWRLEDAVVEQLVDEVRRVGSLWDANQSVHDQGPELLKWLDRVQILYDQVQDEPRVLLDTETKKSVEAMTQKVRLFRDCIHARVPPNSVSGAAVTETELVRLQDQIKLVANAWKALDQCADEMPLLANQLMAKENVTHSTATVDQLFSMYSRIAADMRSADDLSRSLLDQRNQYLNAVASLIRNQKGSTTQLTPAALRDAYIYLHTLPVAATNRADLYEKVRVHFTSTATGQANGNESTDKVVKSFHLRLTASNILKWTGAAKIDSRADESLSADMWQKVLANILQSKGRVVPEGELVDGKQAENARAVRLLSNWTVTAENEFDAARQQEVLAWQNYLLWRADEMTRDFWRTPALRAEEPYFATCAEAFLRAATSLDHGSKTLCAKSQANLERYVQRSNQWSALLQSSSPGAPTSSDTHRVPLNLTDIPIGKARAWLKDRRAKQQVSVILPGASTGIDVGTQTELNYSLTPGMMAQLSADYRGHHTERSLESREAKTIFTIQQSLTPDPLTIVKVNAVPQPTELVFVLDCSNSFKAEFAVAKAALAKSLEILEGRKNLKISLVVFGHSATWAGDVGADRVDVNPNVAPRFRSKDVSTDAATLVGLEDSKTAVQQIEEQLGKLDVWGYTPLYYAIIHGNKQFSSRNAPDVLRRVIVITDGMNQVLPTDSKGNIVRVNSTVADNSGPSQVQQALSAYANTQLDLIHVKKDAAGKVDSKLEEIIEQTGGSYVVLNDVDKLAQQLEGTLEPFGYTAVHVGQRKEGDVERPRSFGTESQLRLGEPRENFNVNVFQTRPTLQQIGGIPVTIYAGDKLELEFDRRERLFAFPFNEPNSNPLSLKAATLQAWRLRPRESANEIRIQIDRADSKSRRDQTLRPQWSFLEIGLNPDMPEAQLWSPDLTWSMEGNRPVGRVEFRSELKVKAAGITDRVLPARMWVCADPKGPDIVKEMQFKDIAFETAYDVSESEVSFRGKSLAGGKYAFDVIIRPAPGKPREERLLVHPPACDSVDHKFMDDGTIIFSYVYLSKPGGTMGFYLAPSERDPKWTTTGWVSTEL